MQTSKLSIDLTGDQIEATHAQAVAAQEQVRTPMVELADHALDSVGGGAYKHYDLNPPSAVSYIFNNVQAIENSTVQQHVAQIPSY